MTHKYFKGNDVSIAFKTAIERTENSFKHIKLCAYSDDSGQTFLSHLHSDQYAQFLYFFMNSLWKESQNRIICDKTMLLLRALNSIFISYKCEMPDIFSFQHAVGSVIGNSCYSDYMTIFQNVTINTGTLKIGKGVTLFSGAKIIGDEPIGDRVNIGVNAVVYKKRIESDKSVILNSEGKTVIIDNNLCYAKMLFRGDII